MPKFIVTSSGLFINPDHIVWAETIDSESVKIRFSDFDSPDFSDERHLQPHIEVYRDKTAVEIISQLKELK